MKPITIIALALSTVLVSCNKSAKSGQLSIAVIPKGTTHIYWKSVEAGAEKAAAELDVKVTFIGPQREDDRSQQIDLVTNQALQNDAIVLAPLDAVALRDSTKTVAEKGKPVVIIDSGLADSAGFITSYVATDNREGGRIAARHQAPNSHDDGVHVLARGDQQGPKVLVPSINELDHEQGSNGGAAQRQQHIEEEPHRSGAIDPRGLAGKRPWRPNLG